MIGQWEEAKRGAVMCGGAALIWATFAIAADSRGLVERTETTRADADQT
jgi:hypothetical protein